MFLVRAMFAVPLLSQNTIIKDSATLIAHTEFKNGYAKIVRL